MSHCIHTASSYCVHEQVSLSCFVGGCVAKGIRFHGSKLCCSFDLEMHHFATYTHSADASLHFKAHGVLFTLIMCKLHEGTVVCGCCGNQHRLSLQRQAMGVSR